MVGELFNKNNYDELLCTKSINEIYHYLCHTSYKESLLNAENSPTVTFSSIELAVIDHMIEIFEKIIRFTPSKVKNVILLLLREYEVENIKILIPYIVRGEIPQKEEFIDIHRCSIIKMKDLLSVAQFSELNEVLKKTNYYEAFQHAYKSYILTKSQFIFDTQMDIYYYKMLCDSVKRLGVMDRQRAEKLIGFRIDLLNLAWLCRLKLNFHMSEGKILSLLLPGGKFLRNEDVKKILKGNDLKTILGFLPACFPWKHASDLQLSKEISITQLENELDKSFNVYCRQILNGMPFHIDIMMAYLFLKQSEVRNINIILNAKRYQLSAKEIIPYLTLYDVK